MAQRPQEYLGRAQDIIDATTGESAATAPPAPRQGLVSDLAARIAVGLNHPPPSEQRPQLADLVGRTSCPTRSAPCFDGSVTSSPSSGTVVSTFSRARTSA